MRRPACHPLLVFLLCVLPIVPATAHADAPKVAVSILPVHSLTSALMVDVGEPKLLLPPNASPHAYQLRPSEARALSDAHLVVWVGPALETQLMRPLRSLGGKAQVLTLQEAAGVRVLKQRTALDWTTLGDHDNGHTHGEAHAQNIDAHLWLDPRNALHISGAIAQALAQADPAHAAIYARNLERLAQRLDELDAELQHQLDPVRAAPYLVFHDAYQYLEARYELNAMGAISLSPERPVGARRLRELRAALQAGGAQCVFSEPQFEPAVVETLIEGTPVRRGVLDPLGAQAHPGPEAYFTLMRALVENLRGCLQAR